MDRQSCIVGCIAAHIMRFVVLSYWVLRVVVCVERVCGELSKVGNGDVVEFQKQDMSAYIHVPEVGLGLGYMNNPRPSFPSSSLILRFRLSNQQNRNPSGVMRELKKR